MLKERRIKGLTVFCVSLCAFFSITNSCAEDEGSSRSVLNLAKIIVTPSKFAQYYKDSPVNINIIDEEEIKQSGAVEITQVFDSLPAVDVIDYGSFGTQKSVHSRGASSSQVITLVNGRPVNTPRDGQANHNQIPLNNIERVEFMRGPASSIYGANAVGGVINIITKSGKKKMFTELSSRTGSKFTEILDFSHGWKIGNFDYFISTNYIESGGHRENSDYQQHNHYVNFGYDLTEDNRVTVEAGYAASELGTPGPEGGVDFDNRQEQWRDYFDITWKGSLWSDSDILLKVYQNLDRLEFIWSLSPLHSKDVHQTKVYGIDFQLSHTFFDVFRASLGASGQENRLNSSSSAKHTYSYKAIYGEGELDLFNDLVVKAGARVDDYSNFGSRMSPSASFSWWFFDTIKTHGLIARSFRTPTFNDLYYPLEDYIFWRVEGNPGLTPEIATSREIGLGTFLFDKIEIDVTYFHNKFEDMINWASDDDIYWVPSNVDNAVTKGVETNLNYQIIKDLKLNLNYTRLSATNTETSKWIVYRPRHKYKGSVNYSFNDRLRIYFTGRYASKRYTETNNVNFLKSYFVADTNISYKITDFAEASLAVYNLFDRDYQEEAGYPIPGTSFLLGTKLTF